MKGKIITPMIVSIVAILLYASSEILLFSSYLKSYGLKVEDIAARCQDMISRIAIVSVVVGIIVYIALRNIVDEITRPIKELTSDARNFKKDGYWHPIRDYDIEEIMNLAEAFDNMADELSSTIRKLGYQKAKLESMLNSLDEGIMVISPKGRIKQMSDLASDMLGVNGNEDGKIYATQIIKQDKFKKLIREGIKTSLKDTIELTIGESIFYVTIVPIGDPYDAEEFLIVFKDVTKLRALEEMRYQFVSNVSHELKTPLTSISGFVETLKGGAVENKEVALRFLNIIDVETKRLYRLIQDILLLSEIDNMESVHYDSFDIREVVETVVSILQGEADKKCIHLIYEDVKALCLERMSRDHMEQVLMNIISNALRYTDQGEVRIKAYEEAGEVIVTIQDTGIGIPEESLERIFERFYRVDKGRSRKIGGTGLGLSIVKHIIQLYDGEVSVQSKVGIGTTFTLKLKKA